MSRPNFIAGASLGAMASAIAKLTNEDQQKRALQRMAALKSALTVVGEFGLPVADHPSLYTLATVMAVREYMKERGITDRGRRRKVIKAVVDDFESKLRQYAAEEFDVAGEDNAAKSL